MKFLKKIGCMSIVIMLTFVLLGTSVSAAEASSDIPDWVPTEDQLIPLLAVYKAQESGATRTPVYTRANVTKSELAEFYAAAKSIDDMTYWDFFTGDAYVIRADGGAYMLYVKYGGELYAKSGEIANLVLAKRLKAESLFIGRWQNHHAWNNRASLSGQFQCHALSLGTYWEQTTWHLEPWRTESNIAVLVLNQCNV